MRKPVISAVVQSVLIASLFVTGCNLPSIGGATPPGPSDQAPAGNLADPGRQDPGTTTEPSADPGGVRGPRRPGGRRRTGARQRTRRTGEARPGDAESGPGAAPVRLVRRLA